MTVDRRWYVVVAGSLMIAVALLAIGLVAMYFVTPGGHWDDFERAYQSLKHEGFHEAEWDGWSRKEREVIDIAAPHIAANDADVRIMWRIETDRNGFSASAVVFYRIRVAPRLDQFIVPPSGGNVYDVTVSEALEVIEIVASTRRF